jgi:hypothetical protein
MLQYILAFCLKSIAVLLFSFAKIGQANDWPVPSPCRLEKS